MRINYYLHTNISKTYKQMLNPRVNIPVRKPNIIAYFTNDDGR